MTGVFLLYRLLLALLLPAETSPERLFPTGDRACALSWVEDHPHVPVLEESPPAPFQLIRRSGQGYAPSRHEEQHRLSFAVAAPLLQCCLPMVCTAGTVGHMRLRALAHACYAQQEALFPHHGFW